MSNLKEQLKDITDFLSNTFRLLELGRGEIEELSNLGICVRQQLQFDLRQTEDFFRLLHDVKQNGRVIESEPRKHEARLTRLHPRVALDYAAAEFQSIPSPEQSGPLWQIRLGPLPHSKQPEAFRLLAYSTYRWAPAHLTLKRYTFCSLNCECCATNPDANSTLLTFAFTDEPGWLFPASNQDANRVINGVSRFLQENGLLQGHRAEPDTVAERLRE